MMRLLRVSQNVNKCIHKLCKYCLDFDIKLSLVNRDALRVFDLKEITHQKNERQDRSDEAKEKEQQQQKTCVPV